MSSSEADNGSETVLSSLGEDDARDRRRSYFFESFGGDEALIPMLGTDEEDRRDDSESMGTVSTSMLLQSSSSGNEYTTANEREPMLEEAVRMLKREVAAASPRLSYVRASLESGFEAHEYKIPRKVSQTSVEPEGAGRTKAPHSPSLLNNILVPSPVDSTAKAIPALRAVSGSHHQTWEAKRASVASVVKLQHTILQPPERARITKMTDTQMDLTLNTLLEYQKDLEATAGRGTDTPSTGMPVQHIDSSSIKSFDSQEHKFCDIYSITRIATLIACCLVIPPLFFMVASGDKGGGVSNYRLMRMVMNSKHRAGLMKGFVWDVDVGWLRYLCLVLGIIETLGIMACIGCGIGIGTRREI